MQPDIVNETTETTTAADTTSNISTTQAVVTDNVPTTTAVTSKAEQAATTVTQTEIIDNTDSNSGENIVQTEPTEIVTQAPVTTKPVQPPDTTPTTTKPVQPPDIPPTTTKPIQPPDMTTEEIPVTSVNPNIKELEFGYIIEDDPEGHQKEKPSQKIAMKCMSFCETGETLTVDVSMADESLKPIFYATAPLTKYGAKPSLTTKVSENIY